MLLVYCLAYLTISAVRASTCSGVILSLYSMWSGDVARKTLTASHAQSMSFCVARAREATEQSRTVSAMVLTLSKSPGEEIAKPASITSTFRRSRHFATSIFSFRFIEQPGDCSPSRSFVSKILI